MQPTSLSLLELLKDGSDPSAWQSMLTIYQPLIKKWLGRLGTPESERNDLSQNVLAIVVSKLPDFEHAGRTGSFRAWLRNITRNCLLEFWRKNKFTPVATGKTSFQENLNQLADNTSELSQIWDKEYDEHVLASLLKMIRMNFSPKHGWHLSCSLSRGNPPGRSLSNWGSHPTAFLLRNRE